MSFLRAVKLILTLHCEESTRLQSEALERRLSFAERWAVRLHYLSCKACRVFRRQLQFIQSAARESVQRARRSKLPDSVRKSIRDRLAEYADLGE